MTVKAAVLPHARGTVAVQSVELGEPGPGEVLVRMEACGICHSDLYVAGLEKLPAAPVTLGHEGIGRVEALGAGVTEWATGGRVGITFMGTTCAACEWCASGRERFCPKQTNFGYSLNGALSQYAIAPAAALVRSPRILRRPKPRPSAVADGRLMALCARRGWASAHRLTEPAARRSRCSDTAASGTWRCRWLSTEDGAWPRWISRSQSSRWRGPTAPSWRSREKPPAAPCRKSTAAWTRPSC
ncbi:fragment of zinc-type alcohol dehydrogenase (part 1/2) [Candidatus Sulfopaludibacter sp. SbA4]|nr:fragment of zinc-type alcohol dehydrogenase (part 1/2) [Candidatus Sulfopaludibacter sp. SbA4]